MNISDTVFVSRWGKVSKGTIVAKLGDRVVVHAPTELIETSIDYCHADASGAYLAAADKARADAASARKRRDEYQAEVEKHELAARELLDKGRKALRGELAAAEA